MGDRFAEALSKGLKHMNPELINISDNRLTKVGSQKIFGKLKPIVKQLNVSENKLDSKSVIMLGQFAKTKATK